MGRSDTRFTKVLRDVWTNRARSALVVLSIAIGVFCVGMVIGAQGTILDALAQQYRTTNPANATLITDPFDDDLVRSVRLLPGVKMAEARYAVNTRIETSGGQWKDLVLFAIPDFRHIDLNRVAPQDGAWPPPSNTLLLERTSRPLLGLRIGTRATLEMPDGRRRTLTISGTAHDINQPATAISGLNYGYVTFATLAALGQGRAYNQLYLRVRGDQSNTDHIWSVADAVRTTIQRHGLQVQTVVVPPPGKLWVYDAVQSMLLLLAILGVASLGMSAFLVVNTVIAEVTLQIRQVGIMKAIGASPRQIGGIYLATVVILSLLALCIGIPLGIAGAFGLVTYATSFLDFDASALGLSPLALGLEVSAGICIPLLAALVPIVHGSRITVREAITSYGTGGGASRTGDVLARLSLLPQPIALGLGNTFRRRGRLIMTLVALSLGGAIFISVLSVRASLLHTLDDIFGYRNYDVQVSFTRPFPVGRVTDVAAHVPGVVGVEGWGTATGERNGAPGLRAQNVSIVAPPAESALITPVLLHGRWLHAGDGKSVVVNSDLVTDEPDLHIGAQVPFTIDGHPSTWKVVGVVRGVQNGPIAYVTYPSLMSVTGQRGLINRLVVTTARHDSASEAAVSLALQTHLKAAGFPVDATDTTAEQRAILGANFDVIVVFLLIMALLLAAVGGLGLMGTMGINILERTREIGIMRAIGASNHDLMQVILVEGIVIAAMSWIIGAIAALPLSPAFSAAIGSLFIHAPLDYTFSAGGALIWLVGSLIIAVAASLVPAWHACRLTVRDVLAYE